MHVGFIGLGKLGLPCAAAMSVKSNSMIHGYDVNPNIQHYIDDRKTPYIENNLEEFLDKASFNIYPSINRVLDNVDIVFVAVPTPHIEKFEGNTPIPDERSDFEYSYLKDVITQINNYLLSNINKKLEIVIISTVLPGTIKKQIRPLLTAQREGVHLIYNPYFIAMGTTINDFLNPEFILLGGQPEELEIVKTFYSNFMNVPIVTIATESAELVKVSYNTFIGMKIIFANALAEITEKIGGDVNEVTNTLSLANNRIISNKYLTAGMGDGGGCHPRDQIAMSWLAQELDLSFDIFEFIAKARDMQTLYLAKVIKNYQERINREVVILGEAYKKNIGITVGSPSRLLQHYLKELNVEFYVYDPLVKKEKISFNESKIFFIATQHDVFYDLSIPVNSIVIDPWGNRLNPSIQEQYGIFTRYLGRQGSTG